MGAERVHEILARELGPRWATTKLVEFDDVPAASASIGQVHKAVWRDGREVAVKIQYPGAAEALMSDLNQLSRVARVAGSWVPGVDVKPIMDELKARMSEELDYHLEGRHQRHFAHAFRDDDDVLVPDVLVDSRHVLVTEWVDGRPLSRIITEGTQEERDEAATLYLEFLLRAPNRAHLLHADPHPGNFRVTADGRLGVLDFGAVNRLPHGLPSSLGRVLTEALAGDAPALEAVLREEGFIRKGIDARLTRADVIVSQTTIASLRRFKDDVPEVRSGLECGVVLADTNDVKPGDMLEVFEVEMRERTL